MVGPEAEKIKGRTQGAQGNRDRRKTREGKPGNAKIRNYTITIAESELENHNWRITNSELQIQNCKVQRITGQDGDVKSATRVLMACPVRLNSPNNKPHARSAPDTPTQYSYSVAWPRLDRDGQERVDRLSPGFRWAGVEPHASIPVNSCHQENQTEALNFGCCQWP